MRKEIKIVFMGTPSFAVGVLKALVEANFSIVGVVTAPDKQKGRGRKMQSSEVKEFAEMHSIPVLQPNNLKDNVFLEQLKALDANLQIVVAFRMLPKVVWSMPRLGTFNLHASLLPKYRGAAPINWAIINKEKKTGVTTFFIDEKIDTGEIINAREIKINPDETAGSLHDRLMNLGSKLVVDTVTEIADNTIKTKPQPKGDAYKALQLEDAPKLNSENTYIDWNASPETIDYFVRGLNPYPAAWSFAILGTEKLKIKIFQVAEIEELDRTKEKSKAIGAITQHNKKLFVQLENTVLEILEVQLPGKRKMKTKELLNGYEFASDAKMIVNPHSY